jgi:hypothetical protein
LHAGDDVGELRRHAAKGVGGLRSRYAEPRRALLCGPHAGDVGLRSRSNAELLCLEGSDLGAGLSELVGLALQGVDEALARGREL